MSYNTPLPSLGVSTPRVPDPLFSAWPTLSQTDNRSAGDNWALKLPDEADIYFQKIVMNINRYVTPVIISMGIVGNTLSFLVFVGTHLNRQSFSIYLAFLAAVDNVFLLALLFVWFSWVGIHLLHMNGWCQCILYCTYVCSFLSVWTVVSFTVERYIVAFHPLRRRMLCTRKRAVLVMFLLTGLALLFYTYSIVITGVKYIKLMPVCMTFPEFHHVQKVLTSIDTIITLIVPTVTIIGLNTAIGIKVYKYTKTRCNNEVPPESMSYVHSSSMRSDMSLKYTFNNNVPNGGPRPTRSQPSLHTLSAGRCDGKRPWRVATKRRSSQIRVTRALLITSSVFVLLNLPTHVFRVHALVMTIRNAPYQIPLSAHTWQEFLQFLYYLSFSSNFFLYAGCSKNFRSALRRLFRRAKCSLREKKICVCFCSLKKKSNLQNNKKENI